MSDASLRQVLERIVVTLDDLGVPYHVTGGLASSYFGEPRLTQDIDLVVRLGMSQGRDLVRKLGPGFVVEEPAVVDAIRRNAMFQALDRRELIKVDFHVGEKVPGELERSIVRPVFEGLEVRLVSKEDAILSKLLWIRNGSAKSRQDVLGMLLDPAPTDRAALLRLAHTLGVADILESIEREADGSTS